MDSLWNDVQFAWRVLLRRPGLLAAAVLTLGLGTGANTAIFSVVNGVLFRPPAVADPGRLAWITLRSPHESRSLNLSWPDYDDLRERPDLFSGLAAYDVVPLALSGGGEPERVRGQIVGGGYFSVLGVRAQRGRVLLEADDRTEGAHPVAVLSDALWRRRFGADPSLIGRALTINGHSFEVVGIAPPGFSGTEVGEDCDVFLPLAMHREARPGPGSERRVAVREWSWLRVIGRLRDGVTLARARATLPAPPRPAPGVSVVLTPFSGALHPANRGDVLPLFAVLLLAAAAVLLIACANVGNLLLARAAERRREIAVRLALGATRGRVIRQILSESTLVAVLGALAGLLFAWWGVPVLLAFAGAPADLGRAVEPDLRVLLFAIATALVAGLLCGIAPSLGVIRGDPTPGLKGDGAGLAPRARRTQSALVVSQMALSLLLLLGAGLLLRSLGKAMKVDPGFDARDAVAFSFDLALQGYPEEKQMAYCRDLLGRVSSLPGFRSASLAALLPLSGRMAGMEAAPEDAAQDGEGRTKTDGSQAFTFVNVVWPDYFRTLGTALLRGRDFRDADRRGAPAVAIVNETLARRFWPGEDPLGRRIRLDEKDVVEVIGLARDGKYDELSEEPLPLLYLPYAQRATLFSGLTLVVRATGDAGGTLAAARRMARDLDPDLPLVDATSLAGLVRQRSDKQRSVSTLLALFGSLALVLAGLGLYGVVSFTVARRTREIGVRLALGARPRQVVRLFLWQGVRLALLGVGVGLGPAVILMALLSKVLFGIGVSDLTTFAGVALLLVAGAAVACFVPARRAASLQPSVALRLE